MVDVGSRDVICISLHPASRVLHPYRVVVDCRLAERPPWSTSSAHRLPN
jgi:hypothetical protein